MSTGPWRKHDTLPDEANPSRRWVAWRNLLFAVVAISLYQYATTGTVSWPATLYRQAASTLGDYASRPGGELAPRR